MLKRFLTFRFSTFSHSSGYSAIYKASIAPETRDSFWQAQSEAISWQSPPTKILDQSNSPFTRWFPDGQLNMSYNCLDRHLPTHSDFPAIYYESPITNTSEKETFFAGSDIGWVVGHSFTAYGPLLIGGSTVLYEGKPIGTPDSSAYWKIIQEKKVKGFFTSPTAIRAIRKEDPDGKVMSSFDLSSLNTFNVAGERCDIHTYRWIESHIKGPVINDNYWQTETSWPIVSNFSRKFFETFKPKPGSATKPVPGYDIHILGADNLPMEHNQMGKIAIKLPTPPSFALTIYKNDPAFLKAYFNECPGYYLTGDAGYYDNDEYLHIVTRIDDVINTAGHRLSTGHMEEILLHHSDIVEAAVIGHKDEMKGEIPLGFIVLKNGCKTEEKDIIKELVRLVRHDLGPVAVFKEVIVVKALPIDINKYLEGCAHALAVFI